ncbi:J domain-containing protein, partial [Thalassolituus sp.]
MNPWIILDIESTADKTVVKRAYLRKLKSVNPEEDQQGFMQVREAYDRVMALIDQGTFHDETPIEESPLSEQAHLSSDAAAKQDSSTSQEALPEERAHIKAEAVSDEMQAFFDKIDLNHDRQDSEAKVNSTFD